MNYSFLYIFVFSLTFATIVQSDVDPAVQIQNIQSTLQDKTMEIMKDITNQFQSTIQKIGPKPNGEEPPNLFQNPNPNSGNPFPPLPNLQQMLAQHMNPERIVSELSRDQQPQPQRISQPPGFPSQPNSPQNSRPEMPPKSKLEKMLEQNLSPEQIVSEMSKDQQNEMRQFLRPPGQGPRRRVILVPLLGIRRKSNLEKMLDDHLSPKQIVSELAREQQSQIPNFPQQPGPQFDRPNVPLPLPSQDTRPKSKLEQMLDDHLSPGQIVSELARDQQSQFPNIPQQPQPGPQGGSNVPVLLPLPPQGPIILPNLEKMLADHLSPQQIVGELVRGPGQSQGPASPQNLPPLPNPSQTAPIGIRIKSTMEKMLDEKMDPQKMVSELVRQQQEDFQKFLPPQFRPLFPGFPPLPSNKHPILEIQNKLAQMIEQPQLTPEHYSKLQDINSNLSQILEHPFRKSQDPSQFGPGLEQFESKLPETISQLTDMVMSVNPLRPDQPPLMLNPPEIMRQQQSLLQGINSKLSQLFQHNLAPPPNGPPFQNLPPLPILRSPVEPVEMYPGDDIESKQLEELRELHREIEKEEANIKRQQQMRRIQHDPNWLSPTGSRGKRKSHKNLADEVSVEDSEEE